MAGELLTHSLRPVAWSVTLGGGGRRGGRFGAPGRRPATLAGVAGIRVRVTAGGTSRTSPADGAPSASWQASENPIGWDAPNAGPSDQEAPAASWGRQWPARATAADEPDAEPLLGLVAGGRRGGRFRCDGRRGHGMGGCRGRRRWLGDPASLVPAMTAGSAPVSPPMANWGSAPPPSALFLEHRPKLTSGITRGLPWLSWSRLRPADATEE